MAAAPVPPRVPQQRSRRRLLLLLLLMASLLLLCNKWRVGVLALEPEEEAQLLLNITGDGPGVDPQLRRNDTIWTWRMYWYNETTADEWNRPWSTSVDMCTWSGVQCEQSSGHVISLGLYSLGAVPLPAELSALTSLQYLSCQVIDSTRRYYSNSTMNSNADAISFPSGHQLLPPALSVLTALKALSVSGMLILAGTLPPQYSAMTSLESLGIVNSHGSDILSQWRGFQGLSGTLPLEYSALSKLQSLQLVNHHLTGKLPPVYSAWREIQYIGVNHNFFWGSLPPEYSTLTRLSSFQASYNGLTGSLPPEYSVLAPEHALQTLDIEHNRLTGNIPHSYSIPGLATRHNLLTGCLPDFYAYMRNITDISNLEPCNYNEVNPQPMSASLPISAGAAILALYTGVVIVSCLLARRYSATLLQPATWCCFCVPVCCTGLRGGLLFTIMLQIAAGTSLMSIAISDAKGGGWWKTGLALDSWKRAHFFRPYGNKSMVYPPPIDSQLCAAVVLAILAGAALLAAACAGLVATLVRRHTVLGRRYVANAARAYYRLNLSLCLVIPLLVVVAILETVARRPVQGHDLPTGVKVWWLLAVGGLATQPYVTYLAWSYHALVQRRARSRDGAAAEEEEESLLILVGEPPHKAPKQCCVHCITCSTLMFAGVLQAIAGFTTGIVVLRSLLDPWKPGYGSVLPDLNWSYGYWSYGNGYGRPTRLIGPAGWPAPLALMMLAALLWLGAAQLSCLLHYQFPPAAGQHHRANIPSTRTAVLTVASCALAFLAAVAGAILVTVQEPYSTSHCGIPGSYCALYHNPRWGPWTCVVVAFALLALAVAGVRAKMAVLQRSHPSSGYGVENDAPQAVEVTILQVSTPGHAEPATLPDGQHRAAIPVAKPVSLR